MLYSDNVAQYDWEILSAIDGNLLVTPYSYRVAALKLNTMHVGANRQLVPHGMFHLLMDSITACVVWLAVRLQYTVAMPITGNTVRWQLVFFIEQRHAPILATDSGAFFCREYLVCMAWFEARLYIGGK